MKQDLYNTQAVEGNEHLMTEACQSTLQFRSQTLYEAVLGQELLCNSLGKMIVFRQKNLSYDQYEDLLQRTVSNIGNVTAPLPILPRNMYERIPRFGKPLT